MEAALGYPYDGNLLHESPVQVSAETGTLFLIEPHVTIDDYDVKGTGYPGQHRKETWQLSLEEMPRLIGLHLFHPDDDLIGTACVLPFPEKNAAGNSFSGTVIHVSARDHAFPEPLLSSPQPR